MGNNDEIPTELEWRKIGEKPLSEKKQPLSTGILPSSFYSHSSLNNNYGKIHVSSRPKSRDRLALNGTRQNDRNLSNLLSSASLRVRQNQFQEILDREKLRRASFRDALSPANRNIKLFGLQADAFSDYDGRLAEYLHYPISSDSNPTQFSSDLALKFVQSLVYSDTKYESIPGQKEDATSISSIDEQPKRQRAYYTATASEESILTQTQPMKQTQTKSSSNFLLCNNFKSEFEREKSLGVLNVDDHHLFLPPLWSMEPRIFSKEVSSTGKRKYVVTSFGRFADYYWRKCVPTGRHYYELIRENTPCRLYFDLEFSIESNQDAQAASEQLMTELIEEVCCELHATFKGLFDPHEVLDRKNFVDLDSSTSSKFSRHIIVHLPKNMLFLNTAQVGIFVKNMVARLAEEIGTGLLQNRRPTLAKYLFVNAASKKTKEKSFKSSQDEGSTEQHINGTDSSTQLCSTYEQFSDEIAKQSVSSFTEKTTCFVDLGVYTKNRLFRLLGSTKFGKPPSAALRIAEANKFPFKDDFRNEKFYVSEQKKDSVPNSLFLDNSEIADETKTQMLHSAADWSSYADALEKSLVVPLNWSRTKWQLLPTTTGIDREKSAVDIATTQKSTRETRYTTSSGPSPFPLLDQYVRDILARRGGVDGDIRSWSISYIDDNLKTESCLKKISSITYQIIKNRWCERIGRHHKSNNIMWTADLVNMYCFQTCHDEECRRGGYRGKAIVLPADIRLSIEDYFFDIALANFDEEAVIAEAERKKREEQEFEKALLKLDISG